MLELDVPVREPATEIRQMRRRGGWNRRIDAEGGGLNKDVAIVGETVAENVQGIKLRHLRQSNRRQNADKKRRNEKFPSWVGVMHAA